MKLIPLLISILLLVSSKLKPLRPMFQKITAGLISVHQPIHALKTQFNQQKLFIASLPGTHFSNLVLKAENEKLKTQNLLLKNQLNLKNLPLPVWPAVPVRIIKLNQSITATSNSTDKIKPGMPLIQSTNLIGIVQKVSPPIIYILPLTDNRVFFPIQTSQGAGGDYIVKDHTPQITNLPLQTTLNPNDTLFTLPTEQIPEGLIVGRVGQSLTQPSNPTQRIEIKLSTNPSEALTKQGAHILLSPKLE